MRVTVAFAQWCAALDAAPEDRADERAAGNIRFQPKPRLRNGIVDARAFRQVERDERFRRGVDPRDLNTHRAVSHVRKRGPRA